MLAFSISRQRMEPVTRWNPEVIKTRGQVNILELSSSLRRNLSRETPALAGGVDILSATVCERLYHRLSVMRHVTRCKRLHFASKPRAVDATNGCAGSAWRRPNDVPRLRVAVCAASIDRTASEQLRFLSTLNPCRYVGRGGTESGRGSGDRREPRMASACALQGTSPQGWVHGVSPEP